MTLTGTNSYVVDCGAGEALVIDPGPPIARHVEALIAAAKSRSLRVAAIAVTHGHPDHAPASAALARATGAPVYAHPASEVPHDRDLPLDAELSVGDVALRVLDAPGHTFEHAVFYLPDEAAFFSGDVVLGEGTVVIAPPAGAMRPYQHTLHRMRDEFPDARTIHPGHGPVVSDARGKLDEYIAHREQRERELLDALAHGPQTIPELVVRIYTETRRILWPAAARQMLAYLLALQDERRVAAVRVDRAMTAEETAILNPDWVHVVGPVDAPVVEAELGSMVRLDTLYRYELA
jgi:glyoxylase-like metal-dependent hydrolase (beta-lactamase superfamily II)